jgi:hypothetical protein
MKIIATSDVFTDDGAVHRAARVVELRRDAGRLWLARKTGS